MPPFCHHASMHLDANMTKHSSPLVIGNVKVTPPPLGNMTGQSTNRGRFTFDAWPVLGFDNTPWIDGCTVHVIFAGS